jgi:hypothetical protein
MGLIKLLIKEAIAASFFIAASMGIIYVVLQTSIPETALQMAADRLLKEEEVEPVGYTCDKNYDKVYETCRRDLVGEYYELYKKDGNRQIVNTHCEGIAAALTCTEI